MELTGAARDVVERFDRERGEVEDLARVGREGLDTQTLKSRIVADADSDGEWKRRWLIAPLTALERFRDTHQVLATLLETERAALAHQEQVIAAIERRHAGTPVGRPERDQLEAQARSAVAHGAQLRHNVLELERRLTGPPDPLVDAARVGLAVYLPVVLELVAESISTQLEGLARQVAGTAMDLLGALTDYEAVVGRAEQAAGQLLRAPRPSYPARRALEEVVRARGIEWTTTTAQAEAEVAR